VDVDVVHFFLSIWALWVRYWVRGWLVRWAWALGEVRR
jgi:hypothetical protein